MYRLDATAASVARSGADGGIPQARCPTGSMQLHVIPVQRPIARPWYAWPALVAALFTGIAAIPVGLMFMLDPSGGSISLPTG